MPVFLAGPLREIDLLAVEFVGPGGLPAAGGFLGEGKGGGEQQEGEGSHVGS